MLPPPRRLFRVYVDESGDRGWSGKSKPSFVLAAVVIRDDREAALRALRDQVCADLKKPVATVLHWSNNITKHEQRKHVARLLGQSDATLMYVIVDKDSVRGAAGMTDQAKMYNYAVRRLLERVSWYVNGQHGEAILTFAHVKHFPYQRLNNYLNFLRGEPTSIKWAAVRGSLRIEQPSTRHLLQVADMAAGCLTAAVVPDEFGDLEADYLMAVAPRIFSNPPNDVRSYGLNVIGDKTCLERLPWWKDLLTAL